MAGIIGDLVEHWYIDLSIPLVAALIGYVTKLVAIRMMFRPIEFVGVRPYLGWQGIVPRRAARMASIAVETMTRDLISAQDVLDQLDPDAGRTRDLGPAARGDGRDHPRGDARVPTGPVGRAAGAGPRPDRRAGAGRDAEIVREVLSDIQSDVDSVFDLKHMVITNLVTDKALLNRIFLQAGRKEFRFIARSGIWFGGAIGLLQLTLWLLFHEPLIMPAFGLIVGWSTDWLALKMIFNPKRPVRVLGITVQGLFLRRRVEVAAEYGALIADEVITARRVIEAILQGPMSDRVVAMIARHVDEALDRNTGVAKPLVVLTVGSDRYRRFKDAITAAVMRRAARDDDRARGPRARPARHPRACSSPRCSSSTSSSSRPSSGRPSPRTSGSSSPSGRCSAS